MSSQTSKSTKQRKPQSQAQGRSCLSTHLEMVELKQRIITSIAKLSDRDTHQIALEELQAIAVSLSADALPLLLNSLYDSLSNSSNSKPSVKKESMHLLSAICQLHHDLALPHLGRIISHIVRRLKDPDSSVRDACREAIGVLSVVYLKGGSEEGCLDSNGVGSMVGLFVRPLLEAMGEQDKGVQAGAAMCMAKMVDCAAGGSCSCALISAFQKLCPKISKFLSGQNFNARAALLGVVASLSQVGAIAPQSLEQLLQSMQECLRSTDWATRKAASDSLIAMASSSTSSNLVSDEAADSTVMALEACRFDKVKHVRESMTEALQLWKKLAGKEEDGVSDVHKSSSHGGCYSSSTKEQRSDSSPKMESASKTQGRSIGANAIVMLKKKAPVLTDKDLNPDFFQNLETRGCGDLPVEVVVPLKCPSSSNIVHEEASELNDSRTGEQSSSATNEPDWVAIQRQIMQMEKQQAHLINVFQEFMDRSCSSMAMVEDRVRSIERVVEEMGRDLSRSSPSSSSMAMKVRIPHRKSTINGGRRGWDKDERDGLGDAIRTASEDSGHDWNPRPPACSSWSTIMHAAEIGDVDAAYVGILSKEDDQLLVELMDGSGPMLDRLSDNTVCLVLRSIVQFLLDPHLLGTCLPWIHQLADAVLENGPDTFGIPLQLKKDLLVNFHDASSSRDLPEDWEGAMPDQLLLQLASSWGIELHQS